MPLSRSELEALDPADPVDAAILQDEALHYFDTTETLDGEVVVLEAEVEEVAQDAHEAERRVLIARVAQQAKPSNAIKLARRS